MTFPYDDVDVEDIGHGTHHNDVSVDEEDGNTVNSWHHRSLDQDNHVRMEGAARIDVRTSLDREDRVEDVDDIPSDCSN